MLKNVIDTTKISSAILLLRTFPHIWISIPWLTNHARECQQKYSFILHGSFIFPYFRINISQISQISTIWKNINLSISNDMWPYVFRSEVGSYFFFFFRTWLIYFFSCVAILHLIRRREGVVIYCKLIPDWIKLNSGRILLPAQ